MNRGALIWGTAAMLTFAFGLWVLIGQYDITEECEEAVRAEDGFQCTDYDLVDNRGPLRERLIYPLLIWLISGVLALGTISHLKKSNGDY